MIGMAQVDILCDDVRPDGMRCLHVTADRQQTSVTIDDKCPSFDIDLSCLF